ncbi:hypothetical protein [Aeromicrobium phragmitis]|uniref:hypothetical protein n=1 Tax=Aeromicrobium phragmitis TaxID=2478914 RepID=UPI00140ABAE7|nr:hypothetical protein [Aeromicrobium phragmitis]
MSFEVDDLERRTRPPSRAELRAALRDVVNYRDVFRLCYIRGPEGLIVMLFESLT